MAKTRFQWAFAVYFLITLGGCVYQTYFISDQYFAYDTVTQLTIERPQYGTPPKLIPCFYFEQIYNETILKANGWQDIKNESMTVDKIFASTPSPKGLIYRCKTRPGGYRAQRLNGTDCDDLFVINKFFKQRFVCYSFTLKNPNPFLIQHLTNSIAGPKYYQIFLDEFNTGFVKTPYYVIYLHDRKLHYHGRSDGFTEHFRGEINETTKFYPRNFVTISYSRYESRLLPRPYNTKCIDYEKVTGFKSSDECYEKCVKSEVTKNLGKIPFSVITNMNDSETYQVITEDDLKNASFSKQLYAFEDSCQQRCSDRDCNAEDYVPKIIASEVYKTPGFELYAPNEPDVITEFKPRTTPVDYITMVSSCIGFWFGFSPLYFMNQNDVLSWVANRKRKKPVVKVPQNAQFFRKRAPSRKTDSPFMRMVRDDSVRPISSVFNPLDPTLAVLRPSKVYNYVPILSQFRKF